MKLIDVFELAPVYVNSSWYRRFFNLWPPFLGTGIRVAHISDDFKTLKARMSMRFYNRNAVGSHFGGSIYAMTDPFYVIMLIKLLGPGYIVWDQAANIEFLRPGYGTITAEFKLTDQELKEIRRMTDGGDKYLPKFSVNVLNQTGQTVARVQKTLYIRKKRRSR